MRSSAHDHYLNCPLLENNEPSNETHRDRNLGTIFEFSKQKIGFLGLNFKEGTNDLRDSPIVDIFKKFMGKGVDIKISANFSVPRHLETIRSSMEWMMKLPREETRNGLCLSYSMCHQSSIRNSNMIGATFLAGAAAVTRKSKYEAVARQAMEYSCARQLYNGAWYYGEDPMFHWIDVFHTGYNLDALKKYQLFSGDASYSGYLERGYDYFRRHFFEPSGRFRYYHDRARPIDIQSASQAIDTLLLFSSEDPDAVAVGEGVALWSICHMQGRDGHFYFRFYASGLHNGAAMIHWGQATMYKALACLVLRKRQKNIGPLSLKEV